MTLAPTLAAPQVLVAYSAVPTGYLIRKEVSVSGPSQQHPRGVFQQEYRGPGESEVLVCIDGSGRCLARICIPPRAKRGEVVTRLRLLLDALDPAPNLRLMR